MKDKQRAIQLLNETFNRDFNTDRFSNFIKEMFNKFNISQRTWNFSGEFKGYIESCQILGNYRDSKKKLIDVLIVKLKKETVYRDRARTKQRNFIAKYLINQNKDAALVAFYGDDPQDWRFSFVKMDYSFTESGDVVKELTPAKRFSYLVGVNEPNHTCRGQFKDFIIEEDVNPSLEDIEEAFSIDNVTKDFFSDYRELFLELSESLENIIENDSDIKNEFDDKNISTVDFSKKLLGQIVFIYFLQKKGWLGVGKDKETGKFKEWGDGPKKFFRKLFDKEIVQYDNFFNDILEPLFYEALAKEHDENYYSRFDCKIPFLNGGLFEPINDYDWVNLKIPFENLIFERILDTFDRFNFTVKEDEPLDKEVAVDPEMLGKVFENLLDVTDRKSKGAFYTPREIVHYMCQQSLINYIETNTDIHVSDIEIFIQYGDLAPQISKSDVYDKFIPNSIRENCEILNKLLKDIKIVDPAVGSGAFPMGMMNEIVKARSILSYLLQDIKNNYDLKRETIENCLYGVDIDSSAVDITKLRFWLSLVVDETDIKKINPLPNLDHRIMCGNSLLEEFEGIKLFDEQLLEVIPETRDFEVEQVNAEIKKLYMELGEIHTGRRKDNGRKKEIWTELKKLERKRNAILSKPKDETQQSTFDSVLENRRKESHKKLAKLKRLQKAFFNEQSRKRKRELAEDIDRIEWELVEETLKEEGNEAAMLKLKQYKKNKSKPFFLWKLYFSEVFQGQKPGFDVVIANPPYVFTRGSGFTDDFKKYMKKKFVTGTGKLNLFSLFIEQGFNLLNNNGNLIYIVPNTIFRVTSYKPLRKFIFEKTAIIQVIDFDDGVFENVTASTSVIQINKLKKENNQIKIINSQNELLKRTYSHTISQSEFGNLDYVFSIYINEDSIKLLEKLHQGCLNIGELCEYIIEGIVTPKGKDDFISDKQLNQTYKPFLEGKDIDAYIIKKRNRFILFDRSLLHRPRPDYVWKAKEKLLIRRIGGGLRALYCTYDNQNYYTFASINNLILKDKTWANIKYILALLNSKLLNYYYVEKYTNRSSLTVNISKGYLNSLPIKKIYDPEQKPFIDLVDCILSITKDSDYIEAPERQAQVKTLEKQIDQLVYKLYDLTPEEIEIVEGFNGEK